MQDLFNILRGTMNVSRHISIDDEYIKKMEVYINRHNGNMGAALRDMINQAGKYNQAFNSSALDTSLLNWMLQEIDDILVPGDLLDKLIDPMLINSMGKLEENINRRLTGLEWGINLCLKCDNDNFPTKVLLTIRGTPRKIKFIAGLMSQFLVKNSLTRSPLAVRSVVNFNECIKVELSRSDKTEAEDSLITFFGGLNGILGTVKGRPDFWIPIIKCHNLSNYNMVTIHRNSFEDILANDIPAGEVTIEFLAKRPIREIPLKDLLWLLKEVYENSRIVDRVEIEDDKLVIFHNYRAKQAVDKLKKIILTLLESNGHLYDGKSTENMIVLTHRPDIGLKINELIDDLKTSSNKVDRELLMFITFLNGLKEIPDIPLSLFVLGRRVGKSIMQEYELENNIKEWNLGKFKNAFETIDSKLHRESEWKTDGKNLYYTVRKCSIAQNDPNKCICYTIREMFKGAMDYAFSNKAELDVQKLLSKGDNICEVVVRI